MTATDALTVSDTVWTQLVATPNVNTFDGEVTAPPTDADGRVHAYAVYYPSPGMQHALLACAEPDTLDWTFQVTCVGGDRTRTLWCVRQVRAQLAGFRIATAGGNVALRELGDPGPLRRDDDTAPPRFFVPLDFAASA